MRTPTRVRHFIPVLLLGMMLVSVPAFPQVDITGGWATMYHEDPLDRRNGPQMGEYVGLPINDAARFRAETWDPDLLTLPEHQCIPHPADYENSFSNLRVSKEEDPITFRTIAYHTMMQWMTPYRTIWMDGRLHPPEYAAHTWQGFSTGRWEGNILTVTTTHLKTAWIRRNGVPRSDMATLTEHFVRHDDVLEWITVIDDPIYLTEPFIRSRSFVLDPNQTDFPPYPCGPQEEVNEVERPVGVVPHHLPGTNTELSEYRTTFGIPEEAAGGGAETIYPEYMLKMRQPNKRAEPDVVRAQPFQNGSTQNQDFADAEIHVLHVQGNVYMLTGAGGNVTVQVGDEGVLLVDASVARVSDKILAAIRQLSNKPIRYLLNTHAHPDHTGGNENISKAGINLGGGTNFIGRGAAVVAHGNVYNRMTGQSGEPPAATAAWPTDAFFSERKDIFFNGEAVQMFHQPAAHTDGDSIVFFRRSDVISTGDIFVTTSYPIIDLERGGSINGVIAGLNRILELAVPGQKQEGGTMIIPGHGRLCDEADVFEYRNMATIIRDRVQDMIKRGLTLEQVKAARPTRDYDGRYGAETGFWTTSMFVEAVYRGLSSGR